MENKSKLGLVLVVTGALIFVIGGLNFIRNPDVSIISGILPSPTPYAFKITPAKQHWKPFGNNRVPIGSWIVSVPGDNKTYQSSIPINANNMLCVNFVKGKSGRATFKVKERSWDIEAELGEFSWYQGDFYLSGKRDDWHTIIKGSETLQFQAKDNVELWVEVWKR